MAMSFTKKNELNFIYINKLGAHFPYEGKYPEDATKYSPHMALFEPLSDDSREKLINSYKNVIRWNVGGFFKQLVRTGQLENTVVIYTSDHGQNLFDQGVSTHCNRISDSPYQALVPLFIMTRNKSLLDIFEKNSSINKNMTSHFNIFPTILTLMGYPRDAVEQDYTKTLFSPIQRFGKYSSGNILLQDRSKRNFSWKEIPARLKSRIGNPPKSSSFQK